MDLLLIILILFLIFGAVSATPDGDMAVASVLVVKAYAFASGKINIL